MNTKDRIKQARTVTELIAILPIDIYSNAAEAIRRAYQLGRTHEKEETHEAEAQDRG